MAHGVLDSRGGLWLGGKQGLHDSFVGETTRYVLQKASSRVILTAPPSGKAVVDPMGPTIGALPEHPLGHPTLGGDGSAPGR